MFGPLETHRLVIRQFEPDDWKEVHEYTSDPEVMAYIPGGQFTQAQARAFVTRNAGEQAEEFAVILKDEGRRSHGPAPEVGEHSRVILAEAGYSESEIDGLIDQGAVAAAGVGEA